MSLLVSFVAPIYKYHPILLHSLIAQEYDNWELILVHDGPNEELREYLYRLGESRVKYVATEERKGGWGHPIRELGLSFVAENSDLVVMTNGDNYYGKFFTSMMIEPFARPDVMGTYCNFINNMYYTESRLEIGFIDCGSFMTRTHLAKEVGWKSRDFGADWAYINDVIQKVGTKPMVHIPRVLFYHN